MTRRLSVVQATELAARACCAAGASEVAAQSLAHATVAAELQGRANAGFAHLPDYLAALREGRIDGAAEPVLTSPALAIIACDARGGIAQLGFDRAFADLCVRATAYGLAVFAGRGGYTTGELGHYVRRPAEAGCVALAATNGPPLMAPPGAKRPVYCTNPIAFAAPLDDGPPLLIDQATSATSYVTLRRLAEKGEALPHGWAIDETGRETIDPRAAMQGALLTFGGARGANVALMVEVLAAGLTAPTGRSTHRPSTAEIARRAAAFWSSRSTHALLRPTSRAGSRDSLNSLAFIFPAGARRPVTSSSPTSSFNGSKVRADDRGPITRKLRELRAPWTRRCRTMKRSLGVT